MSTGPTMGELTNFIREHLPRGFSLKITFTAGGWKNVSLHDSDGYAIVTRDDAPDNLPSEVVRRVNAARGMVDLEPVEGTWERS